ncbi:MAG TPA: ATP-binding cassette domain-containing protein [Bryobacteraceae bacterium]|jgi:phospholipid/cholesterol/gamma-HCH transport system ATP-binding protein|nr:ATP-binding cassette domain-containing protein [Bryobacteraceae bacterium]
MTNSTQNQPSTGSLLRFENVTIRFDDVVAVDNVSFEMSAGETRVVLGSAGSGKTTLLKAAIGLIRVDSGRVFLLGRDITNLDERQLFEIRSQVGVLFQEGGLFDSINIAENVAYPLVNRKTDPLSADVVETKVEDALRFVELAHTLEKYPNELSGGMRRRVGIARAVITEPPLVLYDSPTAGLDPITATTIMALIAKERDSLNAANLIVTQRYQDGQLMANFRYNRMDGHLEPVPKNGGGDPEGSNPTRTIFMVMKEGHLIFEGAQARLEASTDAYISKFVPQHHN